MRGVGSIRGANESPHEDQLAFLCLMLGEVRSPVMLQWIVKVGTERKWTELSFRRAAVFQRCNHLYFPYVFGLMLQVCREVPGLLKTRTQDSCSVPQARIAGKKAFAL